uniref:Uncharacterized protein n=1 Tax=Timema tahoe TaxID=61484 RepID=A0A7R9IGG0_9NEOP|nr:unnamed protein product [Timema tahoe]
MSCCVIWPRSSWRVVLGGVVTSWPQCVMLCDMAEEFVACCTLTRLCVCGGFTVATTFLQTRSAASEPVPSLLKLHGPRWLL